MNGYNTIVQPQRIILFLIIICSASAGLINTANASPWPEPVFSIAATDECVTDRSLNSPSISENAVLDCVRLSAGQCMATDGGDNTVGMVMCLSEELRYWDDRLNAAYSSSMETALVEDKALAENGYTYTSLEDSLRNMQRTWIAFRDAACLYEQAQWFGGTLGEPESMACHLHETARQTLKLEKGW
jgi:uncharacterized protein YecT (DUF1311 family)